MTEQTPVKIIVPLQLFLEVNADTSPAYGARLGYLRKFAKYNLLPLFVSPMTEPALVSHLYGQAAGALFMGGSDIHPRHYGHRLDLKSKVKEPERDELELLLLQKILADRKPYFGICRGCQMLGVAGGGVLAQHVPGHNASSYSSLNAAPTHRITLNKESKAFSLIPQEHLNVSTAHHQAVVTTGKDFQVAGYADDGVVEIIEYRDRDYFCFGVQSHPEVEENGPLEPFFAAFAGAARGYSAAN